MKKYIMKLFLYKFPFVQIPVDVQLESGWSEIDLTCKRGSVGQSEGLLIRTWD